ncbi:MAG TPA: SAM-dependent methyltransferase [Pseudonocardiaceae bacterium]|nr:SAM-dependent methyltransferase [Pseudonocardiaceae bacterium]
MNQYAAMIYPSANRVYTESSIRLMATELRVFDMTALGGQLTDITETDIGGVPYVTFTAPALSEHDEKVLSNLSSLYALFTVEGELLRPVRLRPLDAFDSDLLTIQKYSGKTNELFTKLVLNVTGLSTSRPADLVDARLRVFDPMCGRGTTLNQAMMYGFDAAGLDIDRKDFDEYSRFVRTWLRNKRIKHEAAVVPIRRDHTQLGRRLDISLGVTKERYKAGDMLRLSYVNGDTIRSAEFFRPGSFDVIVTDAPYGVRHGSRDEHLSRNPMQLLKDALPGWATVLRSGGAFGVAWNTVVAGRAELAEVVTDAGLTVLDDEPYLGFEHRVDRAIVRDVLVARKP